MSSDSSNKNGIVNPSYYSEGGNKHTNHTSATRIDMESSHYERAATITGHDIRYTVDVKTKPCCGEVEKKEILKGIK